MTTPPRDDEKYLVLTHVFNRDTHGSHYRAEYAPTVARAEEIAQGEHGDRDTSLTVTILEIASVVCDEAYGGTCPGSERRR